jgi:FlaG/FlaF family flagellin (archaellin)
MRAHIATVIAVIVALGGCNNPGPAQADTDPGNAFPQKGKYHVVHDAVQGNDSKRDEFDVELDVSDRDKFAGQLAKDDGTNCRDKQVSIGNGSFSVHMICDAPDGDIHNISVDRQGSFSKDSIDATTQTTLWGVSSQESFRYRLKAS